MIFSCVPYGPTVVQKFWKVMDMFIKVNQEYCTGLHYVLFESQDMLINVIHYHYVGSSNLLFFKNFLFILFILYATFKLLTYLLTPWCRVLLEQLTGLRLVKKFPAFHGTRRFITALTSIHHLSILGPPNPVHIPTSHLLEIHPNIIHTSTTVDIKVTKFCSLSL